MAVQDGSLFNINGLNSSIGGAGVPQGTSFADQQTDASGGLHDADHRFFQALALKNIYSAIDPVKYAKMATIPDNNSKVMVIWGHGDVAPISAPLVEGVSPTPQFLSHFRREIPVENYGASFIFTDEQIKVGKKQAWAYGAVASGKQASLTQKQICYGVMQGGTSALYGGAAVSTITVAAGDVLDGDDVATALNTLIAAHAKKITEYGTGSQNTDTLTTDAGFILMAPFSMKGTFENMTDTSTLNAFIPVRKYAAHQKIMDGEVGSFKECRIILDTDMPVLTGLGAAGIDVMAPVIFGKESYTMARINGNFRVITKMLGYGEDELDQRASQAWKMLIGGGILYQNHIIRLEAALV